MTAWGGKMAKTFFALLIAGLLLGGCASREERAQQLQYEAQQEATRCQEQSLKPGTLECAQYLNHAQEPTICQEHGLKPGTVECAQYHLNQDRLKPAQNAGGAGGPPWWAYLLLPLLVGAL